MSLPQKPLFEKVLKDSSRFDLIHRCVHEGFKDYKKIKLGFTRRKGTVASVIWEKVTDRLIAEFDEHDGAVILDDDDTRTYVFEDKIALRFKKSDENKMSKNYPTSQALLFHDGLKAPNLLGFEDIQRAEIAYNLNELETEITDLSIVARKGSNLLWDIPIHASSENVHKLPPAKQPSNDLIKKSDKKFYKQKKKGNSLEEKKEDRKNGGQE